MTSPRISVVIPSYNRRVALELVLEGLAAQTLPKDSYEVIVVLDGSVDDSIEMLADWQQTGRLHELVWHRQENSGQAAARNTGARMAKAPLLVFLDDDVVPEPGMLEVHLRQHQAGEKMAVLGDAVVVREERESLYHLGVWAWWEDTYHTRSLKDRKPGCRDFCAGNFSIQRKDFLHAGGFDSRFKGYGGEDYEFGWRLLKNGVRLAADRRARARHYHRTTVQGVLHATRQEAHGDKLIGELHPELRAGLRLSKMPPGNFGRLVQLGFQVPFMADSLVWIAHLTLPALERLRLRRRWLWVFNTVRGYAYWQGVRSIFGKLSELKEFQKSSPPIPRQILDISEGLPPDLQHLWVEGPSVLQLVYRGEMLGEFELDGPVLGPLHQVLSAFIEAKAGPILLDKLTNDGLLAPVQACLGAADKAP